MIDKQQTTALIDRAKRVLRHAKYSATVKHVVDNIIVTIDIEVKNNDTVVISEINDIIEKVLFKKEKDNIENMNAIFLILSQTYTNNDIKISIKDTNDCGYISAYNNTRPSESIKV